MADFDALVSHHARLSRARFRRFAPASARARATAIELPAAAPHDANLGAMYSAQKSHETPNAAHASSTFSASRELATSLPATSRSHSSSSHEPFAPPFWHPAAPLYLRPLAAPPVPLRHHRHRAGRSDHHARTPPLPHGGRAWSDPPPPTPTHAQSQIRAAPERVVERVNERPDERVERRRAQRATPRDTHGTDATGFGRIQPDSTGRETARRAKRGSATPILPRCSTSSRPRPGSRGRRRRGSSSWRGRRGPRRRLRRRCPRLRRRGGRRGVRRPRGR